MSEPDTRGDIVDVLLDITWNMILLASDILMGSSTVFPDEEVGKEQILYLISCSVKLDPLMLVSIRYSTHSVVEK